MSVLKNKTQGAYVNVSREILQNPSLGIRERGMLVTLLSLPDEWEFTILGLSKIIPDGKSAIRSSLAKLEELGYITRYQERAEDGRFGKNIIEVHEIPVISPKSDNPTSVSSLSDSQSTENSLADCEPESSIQELNNNKYNINLSISRERPIDYLSGSDSEVVCNRVMSDPEDTTFNLIAQNIDLDALYEIAGESPSEREMVQEVYDTICDMVCYPRESVKIKGVEYPWDTVKAQFLKLKFIHVAHVLERLVDNRLKIKDMSSYLVSSLYRESMSGRLLEQAELHDEYLRMLRGKPYSVVV